MCYTSPRIAMGKLVLSADMEWLVRRSWECAARSGSRVASVSAAARFGVDYLSLMWDCEAEMPEWTKKELLARFRGLTTSDDGAECEEEEFLELVKARYREVEAKPSGRRRELDADFAAFKKRLEQLSLGETSVATPAPAPKALKPTVRSACSQAVGARRWELKRREREEQIDERLRAMREALASLKCHDPLSSDEEVRVALALRAASSEIVSQGFNVEVEGRHVARLKPGGWLVDEVINFYFSLLQKRFGDCYYFNSFFLIKLAGENYDEYRYVGVRRWTRKVDLFARRRVFIPINLNNTHWTLICIDMQLQVIRYFDSMGAPGHHFLNIVLRYLQDEHLDKRKSPMSAANEWTLKATDESVPRQTNGFDCGVFTTFNAHYLSFDKFPSFEQSDINHLRKRMLLSIIDKNVV